MSTSLGQQDLSDRLKAMSVNADISNPSSKEIAAVLEVFAKPQAQRPDTSTAYAYLARVLLAAPSAKSEESRAKAIRTIARILDDWLTETHMSDAAKSFAALNALMQIDVAVFTEMKDMSAMEEKVLDTADLVTSEVKIANEEELASARQHLARFIASAAGYTATRTLAKQVASLNHGWLSQIYADRNVPDATRFPAVVAFVKFRASDTSMSSSKTLAQPSDSELLEALRPSDGKLWIPDALEGLALLTMTPSIRRSLASDSTFLPGILASIKEDKYGDTHFSIGTIILHFLTYHRRKSEEERTKDRLKRYANAQEPSGKDEGVENDDEIDERCNRSLQAGVMQVVLLLSRSASANLRQLAAQIILCLVDKSSRRGLVIQQGGAKALYTIIKQQASPGKTEDFVAVQALAKILITSNPLLVLGPRPDSPALFDVVGPLAQPIMSHTSSQLQQFESLMALTNIASLSGKLQERIAGLDGLLGCVEDIIIDNNQAGYGTPREDGALLCRRAATELICNLVSCETAFMRYTALDQADKLKDGLLPAAVASRLHLLVALADVEDVKTRQAALGALATLTTAHTACAFIAKDAKRIQIFLAGCTDGDEGVQLRAVACLASIAEHQPSLKNEVLAALRKLQGHSSTAVKASAREIVEALENPT